MNLLRATRLNLRLRESERFTVERAAAAAGQRVSEFARTVLLAAAQRRLSRVDGGQADVAER